MSIFTDQAIYIPLNQSLLAMKRLFIAYVSFFLFTACASTKLVPQAAVAQPQPENTIATFTKDMQAFPGYFPFYYDDKAGKIWLEIDKWDEEFLYVNSLPAGVGSNDLGLDRGQLGDHRIVKFSKQGGKILMIQPNYGFRAVSENLDEQRSVEEAFAQSVLHGFSAKMQEGDRALVDLTDFLLRDAHGVKQRLSGRRQGNYNMDKSRSALYLERTKNFPKNSEFDAMITFTGNAQGRFVNSVVPSPDAITVRMHHSFIELPDDNYTPREYDPRAGYISISYQDYATPISQPLVKRFIVRHRLEKKNPSAAVSEAVEPIIYYLDRGAPEPIRSALLEGARWWNQAFESAGYKDAFQVKILPEGVDPMDIRYNLIQWVHRSTRGWSYGSSVRDPRTGEIIKGQVSLGSLRVRQDFLIAQGLLEAYENGTEPDPRLEKMALDRLRQLSAHEVGHTIGLVHNYSASTDNRASVMDYPHPYIQLKNGSIDFSDAYDQKIGAWDKIAIQFGYADFAEGQDEKAGLEKILKQAYENGVSFISDADARPAGSAHPDAHLWDNGENPVAEMKRMLEVREHALNAFSEKNIPVGRPMAELEEVLVPLYFSHRYQIEATAKIIGGQYYTYAVRGDGQPVVEVVGGERQQSAIDAMIASLDAKTLALPAHILDLIPPRPLGYRRGRENFNLRTGSTLDPLSAAEALANQSLGFLLHPHRATRLVDFKSRNAELPGLDELIGQLINATWKQKYSNTYHGEIGRQTNLMVLEHLMALAGSAETTSQARAISFAQIKGLHAWLDNQLSKETNANLRAHYLYAEGMIKRWLDDPEDVPRIQVLDMPDGSPIGMSCDH